MVEPTNEDEADVQPTPTDAVFGCLANSQRRGLVGRVLEHAPEPVSTRELATTLAASVDGASHDEVTPEQRQRAAVRLHHVHLPALADADLVVHDPDADTVALAAHPAFEDDGILEAVAGESDADEASLDALFGALADARRRAILDVLSHQFGPIHLETLAGELESDERDVSESSVAAKTVDRVVLRLQHVHLPQLSEAGLVAYDAEDEQVAYEGHPQLRVAWMHSVFQPAFRASLTGESDPEGIGEIEGREQVISFGQSQCGRADDELFCMFTDTQLLEAGCLTRIRDASRRGVDVYLGTRDPDVREYVREHAPGVVLWEPHTDWLNLPAAGDRVGRLLLADREAAMLGTLREQTTDGFHEEQAIVGEGEHDTLVTMVCQLVEPYLEQIDESTEDREVSLPL
jgi:DNA-binding transcriptional ArsR family regulator